MISYMYFTVGGGGGRNLNHKKMQYSYSKKMFTGRAKPIRIIGDPENHRPDERSSTVHGNNLYHGHSVNLLSSKASHFLVHQVLRQSVKYFLSQSVR